jgi:FKBP-type peptidyl-prolyl cis-trans isomerase FklB
MKQILFPAALLMTVCTAEAQPGKKPAANAPKKKTVAAPALKNSIDSLSYAIGVNVGGNLKNEGLTDINPEMVALGIRDLMQKKTMLLTEEACNMTIQEKLKAYNDQKIGAEKAKGQAYYDANKNRKGVVALPNGMLYEVLQEGVPDGMKPAASDTVVVHYAGTLVDGTEFDNSYKRGEPATFPLNGVIRGWTEILQLMTKGAKWKVYIPSSLGYGDRGAPGAIPPGASLVFEINLLEIKPTVKL